MRLDGSVSIERDEWREKGYEVFSYDRNVIRENTLRRPEWVHLGAGNIFRGFVGNVCDKLIEAGELDTGIIALEDYDEEILSKVYKPYDNLNILVTLGHDGKIKKKVIGSIVESIFLEDSTNNEPIYEIFTNPSLKLMTFTITEKGYGTDDNKHMELVARCLLKRYERGRLPIALVSLDNCARNGDLLFESLHTAAIRLLEKGEADTGFVDYICDREVVSYPLTMIDKITPRPTDEVRQMLTKDGISDMDIITTFKKSYVAPFVNAEPKEYLVIEDDFPAGRPELSKGGVILTTRELVKDVERMKVCTCLNPLHTAIAIYGILLGYETVSDAVADGDINMLLTRLGYNEGLPVVKKQDILEPEVFLRDVLTERLTNKYMVDTPKRIAVDTSKKLAIRFGETIKQYMACDDTDCLIAIPLVIAGWLRYLLETDDNGDPITLSSDPKLGVLKETISDEESLRVLLHDEDIFGVDLYEANLAEKILMYFEEMKSDKGAVRNTLSKYLKKGKGYGEY